jgi:putative endonuclease
MKHLPWELIYYEEFDARSVAMKREKELKSHKGRDYIREKILPVRVRQLPD